MKNAKKILIILTAALMSATTALCDDTVRVMLDGNELSFDVPPQIIDGRTLVPLRVIFESLGAEVNWDGETQTVTASTDDTTVEMTIGSDIFYVNSAEIELDVPPQIIDDRTLVPARAVAESFGADVNWEGETQTVIITSKTPEPTASPEPTALPIPTASPEPSIPIEYDDSLERSMPYMQDFQILSVETDSDGNYNITYTLKTFLEGKGDVTVSFDCYDDNGKIVDSWTGMYRGTDYTWSLHEASITVSGKTTKIVPVI